MAFDAITTAELAVGKPLTNELMEKFRNRDEFLNGQLGTLGTIEILNNSFEINDTAVTGGAANWTVTALPGGLATIDTSTSNAGSQSMKVTHPGGNGNGGADMLSDFYEVAADSKLDIGVSYWGSTKSLEVKGVLKLYDGNQSSISNKNLWFSRNISTAPFYEFLGNNSSGVVSVSSATKYVRLKLTGGGTGATVAGDVHFDYTHMRQYAPKSTHIKTVEISKDNNTASTFADLGSTSYTMPVWGVPVDISIPTQVAQFPTAVATSTCVARLRASGGGSTVFSGEHRVTNSTVFSTASLTLSIPAAMSIASSGILTIAVQGYVEQALPPGANFVRAGATGVSSAVNQAT